MPPPPQIIVIGSLNMDLNVQAPRLPHPGETVLGTDFYQAPGGKGGNQAVAAARLGGRVRMIARVGQDAFGSALRHGLETEGIDVTSVVPTDGPTGVALIQVDTSGQNTIVVVPGANARIVPEDLDRSAWESGAWVIAVLEVPDTALIRGFERARGSGGRTILNAAPARPFQRELWTLTDILVVNETEAALLAGRPADDPAEAFAAARVLGRRGPPTVAVTLGAQGSVVVGGLGAWHLPAIRVQPVDTTAAGDAWVGALAVALARGDSLLRAATFASAAGAITVTRRGAQPALPYRDETEELAGRAPGSVQLD